ncbi:MAG: hypothetical protein Q9162_006797 [Coniocarpon cinnabarinum]
MSTRTIENAETHTNDVGRAAAVARCHELIRVCSYLLCGVTSNERRESEEKRDIWRYYAVFNSFCENMIAGPFDPVLYDMYLEIKDEYDAWSCNVLPPTSSHIEMIRVAYEMSCEIAKEVRAMNTIPIPEGPQALTLAEKLRVKTEQLALMEAHMEALLKQANESARAVTPSN